MTSDTPFASIVIAALACAPAFLAHATDEIDYHIIAVDGQAAPGFASGLELDIGRISPINERGEFTLRGNAATPSGPFVGTAVYRASVQRGLEPVAISDAPVGPIGGLVFFGLVGEPAAIDQRGNVIHRSTIFGDGVTGATDLVLFAWTPAGTSLLSRTGDPVSSLPPESLIRTFSTPIFPEPIAVAGDRQLVFNSRVTGPEFFGEVLFRSTPGSFEVLAAESLPAPMLPNDVTIVDIRDTAARINASGQVAFTVQLQGPGIDLTNDEVLYTESAGMFTPIVRDGEHVAGLPAGVVVENFYAERLRLNDPGDVAFVADLSGAGVTNRFNDTAIFSSAGSGLRAIAIEQDDAPGLETGTRYANLNDTNIRLNNTGDVAFFSQLQGTITSRNTAIFSSGGGEPLRPIARKGDAVPGLDPPATYFRLFEDIWLSDAGHTLFRAIVDDGALGSNALIVHHPEFGARVVARQGQLIDVDPGPESEDLREFEFFQPPVSVNARGEIAFRAIFADDTTAAIVASLPSAPCDADFDADGDSDIFDIIEFLNAWNAEDPRADLTADGDFTIFDVIGFLFVWGEGCP